MRNCVRNWACVGGGVVGDVTREEEEEQEKEGKGNKPWRFVGLWLWLL